MTLISAVAVLALRFPAFHVPFGADEGYYSVTARLWLEGHRLYGDLAFVRPPGLAWVYALPRVLGFYAGDGFLRALSAGVAAMTAAVVTWWIVRRATNRGAVAGIICAIAWSASLTLQNEANSETWMLLPYTLSALACFAAFEVRAPLRRRLALAVLGGVALGVAALFKQVALTGLAMPLIAWAAHRPERTPGLHAAAAFWGAAMVALAASPAFVLLAGDSFPAYASAVWLGVSSYVALSRETSQALIGARLSIVAIPFLIPLVVSVAVLAAAAFADRARARDPRVIFAAWWLATSMIGVAASGRWYPHYFLQIVPAAAILVALAAEAAVAERPLARTARVLSATCTAVALIGVVWGTVADMSTIADLNRRRARPVLLAARADVGTPDGGTVLAWGPPVAAAYVKHDLWGSVPWLYYGIATPESRYVFGHYVPSQAERLLEQLESERPPDTVVLAEPLDVPAAGSPLDGTQVPDALGRLLGRDYERTPASLRKPHVGDVYSKRP